MAAPVRRRRARDRRALVLRRAASAALCRAFRARARRGRRSALHRRVGERRPAGLGAVGAQGPGRGLRSAPTVVAHTDEHGVAHVRAPRPAARPLRARLDPRHRGAPVRRSRAVAAFAPPIVVVHLSWPPAAPCPGAAGPEPASTLAPWCAAGAATRKLPRWRLRQVVSRNAERKLTE